MREKRETPFIGYDYKEMTVPNEQASMYLDCYENFGWEPDENNVTAKAHGGITIRMKRNRKIINKMELTRLQRHFEACVNEIEALEKAKTTVAIIWALVIGILGTAFMTGSTFAVVHEPPIIWLCILLAIPGFIGWILPYFVYKQTVRKKTQKIQPLIEAKYEEMYQVCEKGHSLL